TPAGEGKSTTTIGLADGLRRLGKRSIVAMREPSLGPVFGAKGGGTGGGHTQLAPMEDINLHFTGDMHAIGTAHNLLSAMLDNHLAQGNTLGLDVRRISWKRVMDMNDRALRHIVAGRGGPAHGVPSAAVIVVTTRALALHGTENLAKHVENVRLFGLPPVVALNRFTDDTDDKVAAVVAACKELGVPCGVSRGWELGGAGVTDLAGTVLNAIGSADRSRFSYLYPDDLGLAAKLETIAKRAYGADGIALAPAAAAKLARFEALGYGRLPVCVAKTQNSLSDDPKRPGRPRGVTVTIRDAALSAGAGFVVAYAGDILTMPGLPKVPGAETIDIDATGNVVGLF